MYLRKIATELAEPFLRYIPMKTFIIQNRRI